MSLAGSSCSRDTGIMVEGLSRLYFCDSGGKKDWCALGLSAVFSTAATTSLLMVSIIHAASPFTPLSDFKWKELLSV